MRDVEVLFGIEDVATLQQYLYMSEDHKIEARNTIGVLLEFSMDEHGRLWKKNLNFPDVPACMEALSLPTWLAVIEQLKEQPLKDMAGWSVGERIKTRWDEIKAITSMNVSQNKMNRREPT